MVSSAFILWGVTEGSTEEAVTCTAISLLSVLLLFNMDQYQLYPGVGFRIGYLARTIGSTTIIIAVCTVPAIESSTKYSATTAGKAALGVFVGGFVVMMVFMAFIQFFFWFWYNFTLETLKKILWVISVFLITMVLVATGVVVFLAKNFSEGAEAGAFLTPFIIPMIIFLIPFIGLGILMIHNQRIQVGFYRFFRLFRSLNMIFNIQILTLYVQLIAWMQRTFFLGYFIPVTVASLGICACFIAKIFLHSFRHFYLAQKILLGILFSLHLILSFLYISLILENDTERPVKICKFMFIYILIVTNTDDWYRKMYLAKPRKYVYFSGALGLPLLNSAALAVALKLKADTGKQPLDLRLIVLISGSVFLFGWFVIQMSAYYLARKEIFKKVFAQLQRLKDPEPDQPELIQERLDLLQHAKWCHHYKQHYREEWSCSRSHCDTMRKVLKHMTHCKAGTSCQVKHCASSRRIISEWEMEGNKWRYKGSHDNKEMEPLSPADHNEPNTEVTEESSTEI
nr:uncharacterized protein LOC111834706 [Paramormyrops kingsleyae]